MTKRRFSFLMLMLAALCFAIMGCGDDDDNGGGGPVGGTGAQSASGGGGPGGGGPGPGPGPGPGGGDFQALCDDLCAMDDRCGELDTDYTLQDCLAECRGDLGFIESASAGCQSAAQSLFACVTALSCDAYIDYLDEISDPYPCQSQEEAAEMACMDDFDFSFGSSD